MRVPCTEADQLDLINNLFINTGESSGLGEFLPELDEEAAEKNHETVLH